MKASGYLGKREDIVVAATIWVSFILAAGIPIALVIVELMVPF